MIVLVVRAALSVPMISMTMTPHVPAAVRLWTMTITTRTARFAAALAPASPTMMTTRIGRFAPALAVRLWIWMMMTRTVRFAVVLAVQLRIRTRTPRMSAWFDAVESLPSGHEAVRRGKPMTSLLFQEPVLPAAVDAHDTADTRDDDVDDDERPSRRSRRSRSHR